jgi:hypothetical protein
MNLHKLTHALAGIFLIAGITACKDGNSVYDPDYEPSREDPVIESITPANGYLAGVDSIVIKGKRFSDVKEELTLNFGGAPGVILHNSKTEIIARSASSVTGDQVPVRVSTRGAVNFSNAFKYKLDPAFTNHPGLTDNYKPVSPIAIDKDESIYGIINIREVIKLYKITKDSVVSVYSPTTRFNSYSSMKFGPDGGLYVLSLATPNAAIFRIPPGGNPAGQKDQIWAYPPFSEKANLVDLTFDDQGHIWAVGNNPRIYRFTYADKSIKKYDFTANLRSAFVYDGALYVAGDDPNSESQKVWKFEIQANGDLGSAEVYLDYANYNFSGDIKAINFDDEGNMYLGIVGGDYGIVKVWPNATRLKPLYPYVLAPDYYSLTWDENGFMIGARQAGSTGTLLLNKINMYDKTRAPVYGLN